MVASEWRVTILSVRLMMQDTLTVPRIDADVERQFSSSGMSYDLRFVVD